MQTKTVVKMKFANVKCLILSVFIAHVSGSHCVPNPDHARPNVNPIDTQAPVFVDSTTNGKLYRVGNGEDGFDIVHVWGSPYEMGFAHGKLQKNATLKMADAVWEYMEDQIIEAVNGTVTFIPNWFLKDVSNYGLDFALDLEILATERFTGKYFAEELKGLADASGADYKKLMRIHMLGELTKGSCSMLGAWGKSVPTPRSLLQLRALDWSYDGPFKDHPQVTVYHPTDSKDGNAFANFGWAAWIGSITGMSSSQMAISEIGVSYADETFGKESRFGTPFTYLLRDILQFDNSLNDSVNRISKAHRTCDLLLGVGDGKTAEFRGIQYSASVANFYDDTNLQPLQDWHPRIEDTVYWGMDWICPGYNQVLSEQIKKYYGSITPENVIQNIVSIVQTGNLQVAVYDLTNGVAYLSNAAATYESGPKYAYERQFVRLDMKALFNEPRP
ncbi:protein dcd1A-like [Liolophura sinensis]|uniref:protein dcd1A-like n=1 Tax=Liolophura sinensis TaxID=3198878 RepID=UPI003159520B